MPKIAYVGGFLPFLDPLHTIKTFSTRLPTAFPTAFPTRISHKNFPQDFPTRFSCMIFPSWILIGWLPITLFQMLNFHQFKAFLKLAFSPPPCPTRFSHKIFPQDFPTRISLKIFLQEFPTRFSCKIFLSWILIGWLPITLFQMLNFHQSLLC